MTAPARRTVLRVGSGNPAKVQPVKEVAKVLFGAVDVVGLEIPSGVSAQPLTEQETVQGALGRAKGAILSGAADYGVGIEGGISSVGGIWFGCTWVAVVDRTGGIGLGASARFQLPDAIAEQVRAGREMGEVMEELSGTPGIARQGGAMGWLTRGRVTRALATAQALHFAFAALVGPHLGEKTAASGD